MDGQGRKENGGRVLFKRCEVAQENLGKAPKLHALNLQVSDMDSAKLPLAREADGAVITRASG